MDEEELEKVIDSLDEMKACIMILINKMNELQAIFQDLQSQIESLNIEE